MGLLKKVGKGLQKALPQIAAVAPTVAMALGGPLAGTAAIVLKNALNVGDKSDDEVAEMILGGSPDVMLQVKRAEQDFKLKMRELDISERQLEYQDIQGAREMQMKTEDPQANYIAWAVLGTFFALAITILIGFFFPQFELEGSAERFVFLLIGGVMTWVTQIMNFRFGSSRGSLLKSIQQADALRTYVQNGVSNEKDD